MTTAAAGRGVNQPKRRSDRLIDVHSHALLPVWLAAVAEATGCAPDDVSIGGLAAPRWSVESHLDVMDAHDIAACVLSWPRATSFLAGTRAKHLARRMNEDLAEIVARDPSRFGAFANLPLDSPDAAIEEMTYSLDVLELDGVVSPTNIGGVYLGDPRFDDWFAEMDRRSVTLFLHPTTPRGFDLVDIGLHVSIIEYANETTRMLANMVFTGTKQRFPNIKVVCTHAGGSMPFIAHRMSILESLFGAGPNRPVLESSEVLSVLSTFYYDLTASTAPAALDALLHLASPSQLLLGFDYPMMPSKTIDAVLGGFHDYGRFSDAERQMISSGNAMQLLPRLAAELSAAPRR